MLQGASALVRWGQGASVKQRILGGTGISVSEIGVGGWQLSGPLMLDGQPYGHPDPGKGYVIDLIRRCGEMGINIIDTAEHFGAGEGERRIGEAVKGQRDRWVLCSKFGVQVGDLELNQRGIPSGRRIEDLSAGRLLTSLEGSLRRLQTDYIDVYLCQAAPNPGDAQELAAALQEARQKGQVRAIGLCTSDFRQAELMRGLGCLDVVEFPRNLLQPQDAMLDLVHQGDCGVMIRGSLADGRLSGKYFRDAPAFFPEDARSSRYDPLHVAEQFQSCRVFEPLLSSNRTMAQLALRYLLDDQTTHTILLGAKTLADYVQAIKATELEPLEVAERTQLEEWRAPLQAANAAEAELLTVF
jgi:aryl-alcohol dehydrogenase-like predicted oxidoreductase